MRKNKPYKIFSLDDEERERQENTELISYICEGTEAEIKEWFEIINIGGIKLNDQEKLNAIYSGPFVSLARKEFSNKEDSHMQKWGCYILAQTTDRKFCKKPCDGLVMATSRIICRSIVVIPISMNSNYISTMSFHG